MFWQRGPRGAAAIIFAAAPAKKDIIANVMQAMVNAALLKWMALLARLWSTPLAPLGTVALPTKGRVWIRIMITPIPDMKPETTE